MFHVEQDELLAYLRGGLSLWGLWVPEHRLPAFYFYYKLLDKWGKRMNLVGPRTWQELVDKDFLDSLYIGKFLDGSQTLADIGSGAGFPGIPLAICYPTLRLVLVEARQKRCVFLRELVQSLGLTQVEVIEGEAGRVLRGKAYDIAVTRATLKAPDFLSLVRPFLNEKGAAIMMKGPQAKKELDGLRLPAGMRCFRVSYELPYTRASRQLLVFK